MELAACTAGNVPSVVKDLFKFYSNISSHPLSFSGRALHISARQRKAAYCSFYNRILYQTRTGKEHSLKSLAAALLSPRHLQTVVKRRGDGLNPCWCHQIKNNSSFAWNGTFLPCFFNPLWVKHCLMVFGNHCILFLVIFYRALLEFVLSYKTNKSKRSNQPKTEKRLYSNITPNNVSVTHNSLVAFVCGQ